MSAFTDYLENKLIDFLLRGQAYVPPATVYVGLDVTTGDDTGSGIEVTGGSYDRVAVPCTLAAWAGTQGAGTTAISSGNSGTTSNNLALPFPAPTANWGQVTGFRIWDAQNGGNPMIRRALTTPKTVNAGDDPPRFNVGSLTIQIDD